MKRYINSVVRSIPRGIALFFGLFGSLNFVATLFIQNFNANHWWISVSILPKFIGYAVLFLFCLSMIYVAFSTFIHRRIYYALIYIMIAVILMCVQNIIQFFVLVNRGSIDPWLPVPISLFILIGLIIVFRFLMKPKPDRRPKEIIATIVAFITILFFFMFLQIFLYGKTNYQRKADAIVVFGARVYKSGRMSHALYDRVRTGVALFKGRFAKKIIFTGGPGDGKVHECDAMKRYAQKKGIPRSAILLDKKGVNTYASVTNVKSIAQNKRIKTILPVSHFYHLPRIKMAFERAISTASDQ